MRHHRLHHRARGAAADLDLFEAALKGRGTNRSAGEGRRHHKAMQLCRQVERAIVMALAGECGDDVLRELTVDAVEATGSAAQLMVRLRVPATFSLPDVLQRLDRHAATLRCIVAAAICRKRVPTLTFVCLPATPREGGNHD